MTTIAFDGRFVAADRSQTYGFQILQRPAYKLRTAVNHRRLYGLTGKSEWFEAWINWYEGRGAFSEPCNPARIPSYYGGADDNTGNFLVFELSVGCGLAICHSFTRGCPYPSLIDEPMAWGSGEDFALAAMDCGLSAEKAIGIASKRDRSTGNGVLVYDMATMDWASLGKDGYVDAKGTGDCRTSASVAREEGSKAPVEHGAGARAFELSSLGGSISRAENGPNGAPADRDGD